MSKKRSTTGLKSTVLFASASTFQAAQEQAHETDLGKGHCEVPGIEM